MQRLAALALVIGTVLGVLGVNTQVSANPACVSYRVTGPFVGTRQGQRCVPMPNQFDLTFGVEDCQGVPPVGVEECLGVVLQLPSP